MNSSSSGNAGVTVPREESTSSETPAFNYKACLEISKNLGRLMGPDECAAFIHKQEVEKDESLERKKWDGATFTDRTSGAASEARGEPGYYRLQRRFTNPAVQNPYDPHAEDNKETSKHVTKKKVAGAAPTDRL